MSLMLTLAGAAPVWVSTPLKGPVTLILAGCCCCATTSPAHSPTTTDISDVRSLMIPLLRRFLRVCSGVADRGKVETRSRSEICGVAQAEEGHAREAKEQ